MFQCKLWEEEEGNQTLVLEKRGRKEREQEGHGRVGERNIREGERKREKHKGEKRKETRLSKRDTRV